MSIYHVCKRHLHRLHWNNTYLNNTPDCSVPCSNRATELQDKRYFFNINQKSIICELALCPCHAQIFPWHICVGSNYPDMTGAISVFYSYDTLSFTNSIILSTVNYHDYKMFSFHKGYLFSWQGGGFQFVIANQLIGVQCPHMRAFHLEMCRFMTFLWLIWTKGAILILRNGRSVKWENRSDF